MDEKLVKLIEWIGHSSVREYVPYGSPASSIVYSTDLVDAIVIIFGITKEQAGAIINPIADELDALNV